MGVTGTNRSRIEVYPGRFLFGVRVGSFGFLTDSGRVLCDCKTPVHDKHRLGESGKGVF